MGGDTLNVTGSAGTIANTVWFGGQADNYNLLFPGQIRSGAMYYNTIGPVKFLTDAIIWNQSFGGGSNVASLTLGSTIAAPDGTNTGQLFLESTGNSIHAVSACSTGDDRGSPGVIVFSGFFQYSGRRIVMQISSNVAGGGFNANGDPNLAMFCQTVFDLKNGVVGVANTLTDNSGGFGGTWVLGVDEIVNFGGGWYRCSISASPNMGSIGQSSGFYCTVYADNGTGSGAASISYTGDVTKGFYAWRINCMPRDAYAMSNQMFIDDFNDPTMANFDLTNSKKPGFTWYLSQNTPYVQRYSAGTSPSLLSVANSSLIIAPDPSSDGGGTVQTFVATSLTPPAGFVGPGGWKPPFMIESRLKTPYANYTGNDDPAHWTWSLEWILGQPNINTWSASAPPNFALCGREIDYAEFEFGPFQADGPGFTVTAYQPSFNGADVNSNKPVAGFAYTGSPIWIPGINYRGGGTSNGNNNETVFNQFDSKYYFSIAVAANKRPDLFPADWTLYSGLPPQITTDFDNYTIFTSFIIPYKRNSVNDYGKSIAFMNGMCVCYKVHSPTFGSPYDQTTDGQTYPIKLVGGVSNSCTYDYVKIVQ